MAACVVILV